MKLTKEEAIKKFEEDIKTFKLLEVFNILQTSEFIDRLRRYVEEEKKEMSFRYAELKSKKENQQKQILQEATDVTEAYLYSLECQKNYKKQRDSLDKEIKQNLENEFYSYAKTTMGKILVCAIINKIQISKADESLGTIVSYLNKQLDMIIELIKKVCIHALENGEKFTIKSKLGKHYTKVIEMIQSFIPNTFVEYELLCKTEILEYVEENMLGFKENIISKMQKEKDKEIFNLYFGLLGIPPKTFPEISEITGKSLSTTTNDFINAAKRLRNTLW